MKSVFLIILAAALICTAGCTAQQPYDLYGVTVRYEKLTGEKLSLTDFIKYSYGGETVFSVPVGAPESPAVLSFREESDGGKISSCSLSSVPGNAAAKEIFVNLCRAYTGQSEDECLNALNKCGEDGYSSGGYIFYHYQSIDTEFFSVDSIRFCGEPDTKKPSYSQVDQTSGQ